MSTRSLDYKCMAFLLLFCGIPSAVFSAFVVDDELTLKTRLLNDSAVATVRPDRVTLIQLSFNLLSINNVDLKHETFSASGWWSIKWDDSRLNWASTTSSMIPWLQVRSTEIWTPALVVDNSVDNLSAIDETTIPIRVKNQGKVTWNPPGILKTACEMDVTYFPFDTQTCSIQVTSFGYTIQELNISVQCSWIGDLNKRSLYIFRSVGIQLEGPRRKPGSLPGNGEWRLLNVWNERSQFTDDNFEYAKVTYYFRLQRRATYYGLNTMLPVLVNSLLIPLVFLLPHDAGEKIGYCLTVLLAYVVILTIVTDGLPTTAKNQSLLGVYIAMVLTMAGISVALAIQSLNIFHRDPDRPVPSWQANLCRNGLRIMRLKCARHERSRSVSPTQDDAQEKKQRLNRFNRKATMTYSSSKLREDPLSAHNVHADVTSVVSEEDREEMSWKLVAQTFDAFFLRLYFAIIICSSLGFVLATASNQF